LLDHLNTLDRETINFTGQRIEKITNPTPTQRRVFELIGVPIPSPSPTRSHQNQPDRRRTPSSQPHTPTKIK
ncbi:MAG: hypothetical protein M3Y48_12035, partial [Actinomycetota bacterium]|nr:hypothetical protein [Actinomycetota bacterium]